MILTRAVDNRLKQFFTSGEVRYGTLAFQGKGFRSLGQEAIYAAGIRLRRGQRYSDGERGWQGDVVGPIIRDVGVALAMRPDAATVRMVLNAQMGKQGPPMDGKDLHIGDFESGILPATAPLSVSTLSIAGLAMAFAREASGRVALLVHRRRRVFARGMARGHQSVRGAEAARGVLHREQPDGAVDAGARAVRRARICGQGRGIRHPRDHD